MERLFYGNQAFSLRSEIYCGKYLTLINITNIFMVDYSQLNDEHTAKSMIPQLQDFFRFFLDFSDEDLEDVWHFFRVRKLKKGEHLYKPGEIATETGFVVKGVFRVYYLIEGKESTRFLGCENIFISSVPSFTTQKPSIEYVEALENSELLMLSFQDLQTMCEMSPKWDRLVRYLAEYSYNEQQSRIYSLIALTAQERYEQLTKTRPEFIQRIPQYIIANYLGISPETLSRIRKQ